MQPATDFINPVELFKGLPAGAKARADFAVFAARLKSCPDTSRGSMAHFSEVCETCPFKARRRKTASNYSQCLEHFGCCNHLPSMALGVVGYVNERAANRGWQLFAAHATRGVEIGCRENAHSVRCIGK